MNVCFNHTSQAAVQACVGCGVPFCERCLTAVGDKPACRRCLETVRARADVQTAAAAMPVGSYGAPPAAYRPERYQDPDAPPARAPVEPARLILGIFVGFFLGFLGSLVWEKVYFLAHFSISYIYIGVGYAAGYGVWRCTGRGGAMMGFVAAMATLVALMFGHLVLASDILGRAAAHAGAPKPPMTPGIFMDVMSYLPPFHWLFVAVGIGAGYKASEGQSDLH